MRWKVCLVSLVCLVCLVGLCIPQEAFAHKRPSKAAPPSVKRAVTAAAVAPSVTLAWDYGDPRNSGFQMSRCLAASPAVDCSNDVGITGPLTPPSLRQWTDTPLVEGKRYCWRARALWADGNASDYSNRVCYTVPVVVVPPPAHRPVANEFKNCSMTS